MPKLQCGRGECVPFSEGCRLDGYYQGEIQEITYDEPTIHKIVALLCRAQARMEQEVRDELTGLHGRNAADAMLETANAILEHEKKTYLHIVFIDLNGFKAVNDGLGHDAGDEVLVRATERLRTTVRDTDMIIRWGGDEFVIIGGTMIEPGAREDDQRTGLDPATSYKDRLNEALAFTYGGYPISASIGIVTIDSGGALTTESLHALIKEADGKMYQAKRAHKSSC